ncbi:MAG: DUF5916 domain-containing protein [Longimicrobiales bacterium]
MPIWVSLTLVGAVLQEPAVRAQRVAGPVRIDGQLTEQVWQQTTWVGGFRQRVPNEGAPARAQTEFAVAFDNDALYVASRLSVPDVSAIRASVTRRDDGGDSDRILVSLDPIGDGTTAYTFGVTAAGVRIDLFHARDEESARDHSFDALWEADVVRNGTGWTAELRVPWSQLRAGTGSERGWRINVTRDTPALNEKSYYVMVPRIEAGWSSRFALLEGVRAQVGPRTVELRPYVNVARHAPQGAADRSEYRLGGEAGTTLGRSLRLDATFNPDFGQVESDPATINLSAFETQLNERRPFFTQASRYFGSSLYFNSRRIGAPPSQVRASGTLLERPLYTKILGAARLTGQLTPHTTIGLLTALTDDERAALADSAGGQSYLVAPRTGFGVLRLTRELALSGSTAGLWLTGVQRSLSATEPMADLVPRNAVTGGADFNLRFRNGEYALQGAVGYSRVHGESEALAVLQRSSARYYQRPDADYLELEPERTSLQGWRAHLAGHRRAGRHLLGSLEAEAISPGFEVNDAGRLTRVDHVRAFATTTYRETVPSRWLREYSVQAEIEHNWNFGGDLRKRIYELTLQNVLHSYWSARTHLHYEPGVVDDRLTRGGPLMRVGSFRELSGGIESNPARRAVAELTYFHSHTTTGSEQNNLGLQLAWRPSNRWRLSNDVNWSRTINTRQYITQAANGRAETLGQRYVFATIDQTTISLPLRAELAVTPDLSVQVYAQPYASTGRYYDYGELEHVGSERLLRYGRDLGRVESDASEVRVFDGAQQLTIRRPDFNVKSVRTSSVVRWEWRPGSTLFLVWQQDRAGEAALGPRADLGDALTAFSARGTHYFAFKVSYWFGGSW